ncbi:MAG: MBL fold metallo-hydrolase [Cellulosilyticaceae bacterium]
MIKIVALLENITKDAALEAKHGLCLYIETSKHKMLFDVGPDDTFIKNAKKLGIAIEEVDTVIISHGHRDHGGGLKAFLENNEKAYIYVQESAWADHLVKVLGIVRRSVALDKSLKGHPQIKCLKGSHVIDEALQVFTSPKLKMLQPEGNKVLYRKEAGTEVRDTFEHEQNLILTVEDKVILVAGCAHRGMTNIINEAELICKKQMDVVIGGMHLTNPVKLIKKPSATTEEVAHVLKTKGSQYYTCHCTGEKGYEVLREVLGEQIMYLSTGEKIEL